MLVALEVENDMLTLRIADYGSGIPENEQQHIFEPFYQTESDKKTIGSGVGLALVNQIVKTLGGSITLDSKVDVGSVFTVNVPVKAPAGVDVKPLESLGTIPDDILLGANTKTGGNNGTSGCGEDNNPVAGDKSDALVDIGANSHDMDDDGGDVADGSSADTRQLVLIVEDNADVAEYMTMQLKARYRLVLARDGEEGLRIATETVPRHHHHRSHDATHGWLRTVSESEGIGGAQPHSCHHRHGEDNPERQAARTADWR